MKNKLIAPFYALSLTLILPVMSAEETPIMKVYKSPTCGCCKAWVDYMHDNDFVVETIDISNLGSIKKQYGVTPELQSCHTALIDGYIIEGHVPVSDVQRLLGEKSDIAGLAAPGMPAKSPGMGSTIPKNYNVISFDKSGNTKIFSDY